MNAPLRTLQLTLLVTLAILALLFSVELESERFRQAYVIPVADESPPSVQVVQAGVLNYDTLAADLLWLQALQYSVTHKNAENAPILLTEHAHAIADLDPQFYSVYNWFAATYLATSWPVSYSDLETINNFVERGVRAFPQDAELPYSAALNYIGYSWDREPIVRLKEVNRALEFLKVTASRPNPPDGTVPITLWFLRRRSSLRDQLASKDSADTEFSRSTADNSLPPSVAIYFLTADSRIRDTLEQQLSDGAEEVQLFERLSDLREDFRSAHASRRSYLPSGLWSAIEASNSSNGGSS